MITELTRRDLIKLLGYEWRGQLTDRGFLGRLYDLEALPSHDERFATMDEDIAIHTEANDDWRPTWVFDDPRLDLDDDERLLRFIAETVHPAVVREQLDVRLRVDKINTLLMPDGYELFAAGAMSGRPVFKWRHTTPRKPPSGSFPSSLISGLSRALSAAYTHTELDSLFEDEDFPRPSSFGSNKEEKVKAWLRTANEHRTFDHWSGLEKVLGRVLDPGEPAGTALADCQQMIHETLRKREITCLPGGMLTTTPGTANAGPLPTVLPPQTDWEKIDSGGFGTVYKFRDPRLDVDFAIKVFDPHPFQTSQVDARARFVREAGLLFRLRHESIVRIFDANELPDGRPYIRMEYFAGVNLQKLRAQRTVSLDESVWIIGRLAAALEHAHGKSIVHRDIKPSNVLVSESLDELRLIDFGLGILVEEAVARSRLTTSAQRFGDAYAAPELLEDARVRSPAVDVFSLGAIWFFLINGRPPRGTGIETVIKDSQMDSALESLLHRCLDDDAAKRPSAADLRAGLRNWYTRRKDVRS